MQQCFPCYPCALFVSAVARIRGPYWHERTGRRRSYRALSPVTRNVMVVPPGFHERVSEACAAWLEHLKQPSDEPEALGIHVQQLPDWVRELLSSVVDVDEDGPAFRRWRQGLNRDDSRHVAAALLGVGVRSVYRGG
jgi:hypothetical protein